MIVKKVNCIYTCGKKGINCSNENRRIRRFSGLLSYIPKCVVSYISPDYCPYLKQRSINLNIKGKGTWRPC